MEEHKQFKYSCDKCSYYTNTKLSFDKYIFVICCFVSEALYKILSISVSIINLSHYIIMYITN